MCSSGNSSDTDGEKCVQQKDKFWVIDRTWLNGETRALLRLERTMNLLCH